MGSENMVKPAVNLNFYASDIFTSHASLESYLESFKDVDQKRCDDVCSNFLTPENFHELLNNFNVGQKKLLQLLQNYYKNYYMSKPVNFYLANEKMTLVVIENQFYIHDARACACVC